MAPPAVSWFINPIHPVVGSLYHLEHVLFFHILGIIPIDCHIFQRGILNHQPDKLSINDRIQPCGRQLKAIDWEPILTSEIPQVMAWTYVGNDDTLGPVGAGKARRVLQGYSPVTLFAIEHIEHARSSMTYIAVQTWFGNRNIFYN